MPTEPIVYIVDDDDDVREALRLLIHSVGLRTVLCDSAQSFLDQVNPDRPGCVLLDVRMPGMSGLDLQEQFKRHDIHLPTIIISGHGDVPMVVRAMKSGVIDFLEKPFNDQLLIDRVQHAIALDAERRQERNRHRDIESRVATLTPREREVMAWIVAGKLNKVIADKLGVSTRTVEIHRARVMDKLHVHSVGELVQMALSVGVQPAERV
jgi:FixJ family two-component response regulator